MGSPLPTGSSSAPPTAPPSVRARQPLRPLCACHRRRSHALSAGIKDEKLIALYLGVASYRDRCLALPAWQRAIEAHCAGRGGVRVAVDSVTDTQPPHLQLPPCSTL